MASQIYESASKAEECLLRSFFEVSDQESLENLRSREQPRTLEVAVRAAGYRQVKQAFM